MRSAAAEQHGVEDGNEATTLPEPYQPAGPNEAGPYTRRMGEGRAEPYLLALDSGSPTVSVAVGRGGSVIAERAVEQARSSSQLLALVAEALGEAGIAARDLGGVVALRGPGSFTGLRVGLATALGFHQALRVRAGALATLRVLAASAPDWEGTVVGAVDGLRGEWFLQPFRGGPAPAPLAEPRLVPAADLACFGPCLVVGFGAEALASRVAGGAPVRGREARPLAAAALKLASLDPPPWNAEDLIRPLYLRPPAVTLPGKAPR